VSAIYFGTKEEGNAAIKAFLGQEPKSSNISEVAYNNFYTANFGGNLFARQKSATADLQDNQVENLTVSTLISTYKMLVEFLLANADIGSSS
jgi:hypothetical protein